MFKKKTFIMAIVLAIFSFYAFGLDQNDKRDGLEIGSYISSKWAIGDMANYSSINMGGGFNCEYLFPFLPWLGVSGNITNEYVITKTNKSNNWITTSASLGVIFNVPMGSAVSFRPELSYGILMNMLSMKGKRNVFTDQIIGVAPSFRFSPEFIRKDGLSFELSPTYNLIIEKKDLIHYLGFRAGLHYQFR